MTCVSFVGALDPVTIKVDLPFDDQHRSELIIALVDIMCVR